ncbi:uncharacterized protein BP5553_00362 [Venustampulla echinocandica]|uniref:Uncharacterized protein n=1 Tax=Venustampulla echinocandica TaxID=2656787 RepID=A0A370TXZ2_9HELO|nr:uncharacterized protein BP5553_00362 [Venustampulla echinocandica]RDL40383.1 hypothetical protein BP5553_00362 [Venustampulla echinocandica]
MVGVSGKNLYPPVYGLSMARHITARSSFSSTEEYVGTESGVPPKDQTQGQGHTPRRPTTLEAVQALLNSVDGCRWGPKLMRQHGGTATLVHKVIIAGTVPEYIPCAVQVQVQVCS